MSRYGSGDVDEAYTGPRRFTLVSIEALDVMIDCTDRHKAQHGPIAADVEAEITRLRKRMQTIRQGAI